MTTVRIGHNSGQGFIEDDTLSLSEQGYEFQFRLTKLLLEKLQGFTSVTLKTMSGDIVTLDNYRKRGRDGGLDLVVEIDAKTEAAAKAINTRVRNIVLGLELH